MVYELHVRVGNIARWSSVNAIKLDFSFDSEIRDRPLRTLYTNLNDIVEQYCDSFALIFLIFFLAFAYRSRWKY